MAQLYTRVCNYMAQLYTRVCTYMAQLYTRVYNTANHGLRKKGIIQNNFQLSASNCLEMTERFHVTDAFKMQVYIGVHAHGYYTGVTKIMFF